MIILTKNQIILLHRQLIEETGGLDGLRDEGLLDSAISAPFQTFEGNDLYPTTIDKGARLGYGLIKNHAFIDGNKRIGTHVMLVFLALNGVRLSYTQNELTEVILSLAAGDKNYNDLLSWLSDHNK